jgi:Telomeric repeat-binding factor 2.
LAVVVAAGAVVASGSSNTASKVNGGSKTSSGSTKAATAYAVGDEVKLGDWTVKVYAVANPQAPVNQFSQPTAGNKWVGVDTEVKNLSSKPETVSSLLCFDVTDSANRKYDVNITSGVTPGAPDGEVAPNSALRGIAVFEVPADATGLKLNFKCDLLSSGTATINLS